MLPLAASSTPLEAAALVDLAHNGVSVVPAATPEDDAMLPRSPRLLCLLLIASTVAACGQRAARSTGAGARPDDSVEVVDGAPPEEPRHACDPMGSQREVAGPPHPPAVCGNGVIDTVWGACTEICTGGCDEPIRCRTECASSPENCDGAATTFTCESQGYAGGTMACTADCSLDLADCRAVAVGAAVRQGSIALAGDTAFVISDGRRAAAFAVDAESTALSGATLGASLRARRLRRLPSRTLAVGAIGDRLGFVTDDKRFGTIDLAGAVTLHGGIGDANSPALILPEVGRTGSAAVLLGDYQRRVLTVFDPTPSSAPPLVRMFADDNLRVVVVDGGHPLAIAAGTGGKRLVILRWNSTLAFTEAADHLEPLVAVPDGFAFAETPATIDDAVTWPGGVQRFRYARRGSLYDQPPAGLSQVAVAGAGVVAAFGGTLFAHADGDGPKRRVDLFWLPIANPLAATVSTQ